MKRLLHAPASRVSHCKREKFVEIKTDELITYYWKVEKEFYIPEGELMEKNNKRKCKGPSNI